MVKFSGLLYVPKGFGLKASVKTFSYRIALFSLLLYISASLNAQTIIAPLWTDRGIVLRDHLWNLSIINALPIAFTGRIELNVSDANSGSQIFSGVSKEITINKGSNTITPLIVYPANYSILSSIYNFNPTINSVLPPGIFNICYRIYKLNQETIETVGEECKVLESDPLTPPTLIIPENLSSLTITRPVFSWLPPVPNNTLSLLNYKFRLVEKGRYQSAQEAIERNVPIYSQTRILQNSCSYPQGIAELDTGKVYSWQIIAYNDNNYVGASECWTFSLNRDNIFSTKAIQTFYTPLVKEGGSSTIDTKGELKVSYNNEANDSQLTFFIHEQASISDTSSTNQIKIVLPLIGGVNNVTINLNNLKGLSLNKVYELFVINGRFERWWIDFKQQAQ